MRGGALDVMRFAAALLIVVYHYGAEAPTPLESIWGLFARGFLATNFFLMLSGFVLGRAYGHQVLGRRVSVPAFFRKRVERVWPGQLAVLLGLAAMYLAATAAGATPRHPENYSAQSFVMQALLVQAWGVPGGEGWNEPSWSLSALVICYVTFPFIWRTVSRMTSSLNLLALGVNAVVAADVVCMLALKQRLYDLPLELGVIRALPLFFLGACLARIVELERPSVASAKPLAVASIVLLVGLQLAGRWDLASMICTAAMVLALGRLPVVHPSALAERAAKLSFALFVTHSITGMAFFGALKLLEQQVELSDTLRWVLWAASVPAAVGVAWLFDALIDEPVQRWLARRRKTRAAAVAPAEGI